MSFFWLLLLLIIVFLSFGWVADGTTTKNSSKEVRGYIIILLRGNTTLRQLKNQFSLNALFLLLALSFTPHNHYHLSTLRPTLPLLLWSFSQMHDIIQVDAEGYTKFHNRAQYENIEISDSAVSKMMNYILLLLSHSRAWSESLAERFSWRSAEWGT